MGVSTVQPTQPGPFSPPGVLPYGQTTFTPQQTVSAQAMPAAQSTAFGPSGQTTMTLAAPNGLPIAPTGAFPGSPQLTNAPSFAAAQTSSPAVTIVQTPYGLKATAQPSGDELRFDDKTLSYAAMNAANGYTIVGLGNGTLAVNKVPYTASITAQGDISVGVSGGQLEPIGNISNPVTRTQLTDKIGTPATTDVTTLVANARNNPNGKFDINSIPWVQAQFDAPNVMQTFLNEQKLNSARSNANNPIDGNGSRSIGLPENVVNLPPTNIQPLPTAPTWSSAAPAA